MIAVPGALRETMAYWHGAAGERWVDALPALVQSVEGRLGVRCGRVLEGGAVSLVVEAVRSDGVPAVLKIAFRDAENATEPAALALLAGRRVVRLLAYDDEAHALLLERLSPGTPLLVTAANEDRVNLTAADLLPAVWITPPPGHPFPLLGDIAGEAAERLPGRAARSRIAVGQRLLDRAIAELTTLAASQPAAVLLHRDYHGLNILRHGDDWRIIDPKPLVGDRAFDLGCLIREHADEVMAGPRPAERIARRVALLSEALDVDRERAIGWAIGYGLVLGVDDWPALVEVLRLLAAM